MNENRIIEVQSSGFTYASISVPENWSVYRTGAFVVVALKDCPLPDFVPVWYEKMMGNGKNKTFCTSIRANWVEVLASNINLAEQAGKVTILLPCTNKNGVTATTKPDKWDDVLSIIEGEMEKNIEYFRNTWPTGLWVDYS